MLLNMLLAAGVACADAPATDTELNTLDPEQIAAVAEAEPGCWQAVILLGRFDMVEGQIGRSIERFEAVVAQLPDNSVAHEWLGRAYLWRASAETSLGDAKDGVRHLERAVELDPENLDARETLASFHRSAPWIAGGDMDVADAQAEFIRQRDPLRGLLMLANNRMADGDVRDAIELLRGALEARPDSEAVAVQLGIAYHAEEDFDAAYTVLHEFVVRETADPMTIYQLGRTAALSGRFLDEGREAMKRYIALAEVDDSLDMPSSAAWWRLGMIEQHAGNTDAARAAYARALELDPDDEDAREALEALQ